MKWILKVEVLLDDQAPDPRLIYNAKRMFDELLDTHVESHEGGIICFSKDNKIRGESERADEKKINML